MDMELKNYIEKINKASDNDERILIAAMGFINLFPFTRVHINDFSILSGNIEGVIDVSNQGTSPLNLKGNIDKMPILRRALQKNEAIYSFGSEFIQQSPAEIVSLDYYSSFVIVVPITFNTNVIGYACPGFNSEEEYNQNEDYINNTLLQQLTLYGQLVGDALVSLNNLNNIKKLSKREIEVLQRISWGETIKEIAHYLEISEFTIQDHIKSSIKKLNAKNRIHAVSEALRRGIII